MNFLAPLSFWFLALLPVIVVFYLLKRRRTVKLVSSTVLWQRFLAESRASAPFQRLRKNWLMILQLLLALLVVLALARPVLPANVRPAQLRVVILDNSASMNATDVVPTRFERARSEALKWVDDLRGGEEMVVVESGGSTQVRQSATGDKNALRRALAGCAPSDAPTRLAPALQMAESLVRNRKDAEVHLFSDGAALGLAEFESAALPLVYHQIGTSNRNVGITAIDVRANPANPRQRAVYIGAVNFSSNRTDAALDLLLDGRLLETRPVSINGGESVSELFTADQVRDGIFKAELRVADDLSTDNHAAIVSPMPRPTRVALVTSGNALLEKALRALPQLELSVMATAPESERFDVVVLDGVLPAKLPEANLLAFGIAPTNWFSSAAVLEAPPVVDWRSGHPLLRHAGFENVGIAKSTGVKVPPWAVSLLDSPQASLMLAGELGSRRIAWVGFDVLDSNWPLRISFPIFIANAVEWLSPTARLAERLSVKAGNAFHCPVPEPVESARITGPDGRTETVAVPRDASEFAYAGTFLTGVYQVELGTNRMSFGVNLLDSNESNIAPRPELALGGRVRVTAETSKRASLELWRGAAGIALLLLMLEWWYYHRRTV